MSDLESIIKELEEHISISISGRNDAVLDGLDIDLCSGENSADCLKDLYKTFGPAPKVKEAYRKLADKLESNSRDYLSKFYRETGVNSSDLRFSSECKIKGSKGKLRPSRRRVNAKLSGSDYWNTPLEEYINSLNFKKYMTTSIDELRFELSTGTFKDNLVELSSILVEDTLQHLALNLRDYDDIMSSGLSGIRTEEYGGDAFFSLSFNPDNTIHTVENIVKHSFDKYQFDLSCVVSTITVSPKFKIEDFSSYDSGLEPDKDYYLGSFVCVATMPFNYFSSFVSSPFSYIKPVVALFEDDGWVHYNQTDWIGVPSPLLGKCFGMLQDAMHKEYN